MDFGPGGLGQAWASSGGLSAMNGGSGYLTPGSSSSFIPNYEQSPFLQSIAQYASNLGENTYNQAQQEYANMGSITDANMANYLATSQAALNNAQNAENEYQNVFQPEENQLVQDANTYASQNRIQQAMGSAESNAAKSADAARQNSEQNLMSYGIDPSSGRYAGLDRADEINKAASMAAAGQQAQQYTENTGRQLRNEAIQVGETLPGQITNAQNTALQGIAGAENSNLANANTGIALEQAANPYLQTAESLKYPPLGNASMGSYGGGGGGSGGGGRQSSPTSGSGGTGGGSGGGGGLGGGGSGGGGSGSSGGIYGSDGGSNGDVTGGGDASAWPDLGGYDGGDINTDQGDVTGGGSGGWDGGASGGSDGGGYSDPTDLAKGGPVEPRHNFRPGGHVPAKISPSHGLEVDDVPANLNAGEYVIPRDVVAYKGKEFFAKVIAQARKNHATLSARPHGMRR